MSEDKGEPSDPKVEDDSPKGFTSTAVGAATNEPVTEPHVDRPKQTPDQFFNPERERAEADKDVDPRHATKGMTHLGYTEASRIEDTAKFQEDERKAAEKLAKKEKG